LLIASNSAGEDKVVKTDFISIGAIPIAEYSYTIDNDQVVSFEDLSSGATSWAWDFGDGTGTSSEQNPNYSYSASGSYTVTLEVSNFCGTQTYVQEITVGSTSNTDLVEFLNVDLFPNPASDRFFLNINSTMKLDLELTVFDAIGQVHLFEQFYHSGQTSRSYELAKLSGGTYFVKLNSKEGSTYKKLVVTPR